MLNAMFCEMRKIARREWPIQQPGYGLALYKCNHTNMSPNLWALAMLGSDIVSNESGAEHSIAPVFPK